MSLISDLSDEYSNFPIMTWEDRYKQCGVWTTDFYFVFETSEGFDLLQYTSDETFDRWSNEHEREHILDEIFKDRRCFDTMDKLKEWAKKHAGLKE